MDYTTQISGEITIGDIMDLIHGNQIEPCDEFTSAAGSDCGRVEVFEIGSKYLIKYGDNGETNYEIMDEYGPNLGEWLEYDDVEGIYKIIQQAMIYGIANVEAASEQHDDCEYYVLYTSHLYGPVEHTIISQDDDGDEAVFSTLNEAQEYVRTADSGPMYLGHNEYSQQYTIVEI